MVKSSAHTPEAYVAGLPLERREAVAEVRRVILDNLPPGYEEGLQRGMISYHIPLERYPDTYNGEPLGLAALASQKAYMSLYLLGVYLDSETEQWFRERYANSGSKLNMGKSCVRFKNLEDLPLRVIGEAISRLSPEMLIERYEASRAR
jgi:Domain of unknown function (DU1801)